MGIFEDLYLRACLVAFQRLPSLFDRLDKWLWNDSSLCLVRIFLNLFASLLYLCLSEGSLVRWYWALNLRFSAMITLMFWGVRLVTLGSSFGFVDAQAAVCMQLVRSLVS